MSIEAPEAQERSRPWQWPGEWLRDEKFWRDVASRTAASIIALYVGYLSALFFGFLKTPDNLRSAFQATVGMMIVAIVLVIQAKFRFTQFRAFIAFRMRRFPLPHMLARVAGFIAQTVAIAAGVMLGTLVLWLVFNAIATLSGIEARL